MLISFYVLSDAKAQDFLGFLCQLTQRALNNSEQSLLILIDDSDLLSALDAALWSHDAQSFIPHQCLPTDTMTQVSELSAPVLLGKYLPADFSGIVLNTTAENIDTFIAETHNAKPSRTLELIKPDAVSKQVGRDKYKHYQSRNYELTHFKV